MAERFILLWRRNLSANLLYFMIKDYPFADGCKRIAASLFLVKPTKSAKAMMPDANLELQYDGAKEMLLVDNVDNKEFLRELVEAMYEELPAPKKK